MSSAGSADEADRFMRRLQELAAQAAALGLPPFAALVVRDGKVVAEATNQTTQEVDPTAHAEVTAIRRAAKALGSLDLSGCSLYSNAEPCSMCLSAICWAGIRVVTYSVSRSQLSAIGYDDEAIAAEVCRAAADRKWITVRHFEFAGADEPFRQARRPPSQPLSR